MEDEQFRQCFSRCGYCGCELTGVELRQKEYTCIKCEERMGRARGEAARLGNCVLFLPTHCLVCGEKEFRPVCKDCESKMEQRQ